MKEISAKYESQIEQLREANKSIEAMRAISAKYESQKEQLREANKSIETMRAELVIKNKEAETCNERYVHTKMCLYYYSIKYCRP